LGNYIATDIHDRNVIDNICEFYQRSNWLISDFSACDSITLDKLHMTYCMHMYGCELWNLNGKYIDNFRVAWRKVKRRIWKLPSTSHNLIIHDLTNDIDVLLEKRLLKFVHACLNHTNTVCKMLLLSKLHCINSTFAMNYKYLSYKYEISEQDWLSDDLLGRVKMKFKLRYGEHSLSIIIRELCDIRDNNISCDILDRSDVCKFINTLCME